MSMGEFITTPSFVSLFHLNGNSTDSVGGHNGSDTSMTYGAGLFNQCGYFDGANSLITITFNYSLSGTFGGWVNFNSFATKPGLCQFSPAAGSNQTIFIDTDGTVKLRNFDTGEKVISGPVVSLNKWHFLCGVVNNGTDMNLYVNGARYGPLAISTISATLTTLRIGTSSVGGKASGKIDEVFVTSDLKNHNYIRNYYSWAIGRRSSIM